MAMLSLLLAAAAAQGAATAAIDGRWISPSKDVIIAIAPCGGAQCGTVQWATAQAQADARKGVPSLIGAALLTDLTPADNGVWKGKLFIPDRRMRVTAKISRMSDGQLKVAGCAMGGILCESQVWARHDGPLPPAN